MYYTHMPFGKHKGWAISAVPTQYLAWVLRECHTAHPWLLASIREELARRGSAGSTGRARADPPPPATCPRCTNVMNVIAQQFRQLALACHPDRGGSDKAMATVNEALERIQAALR